MLRCGPKKPTTTTKKRLGGEARVKNRKARRNIRQGHVQHDSPRNMESEIAGRGKKI